MNAQSQMKSHDHASGSASPTFDLKDDARIADGPPKVMEKLDAGLRSQEHCIEDLHGPVSYH